MNRKPIRFWDDAAPIDGVLPIMDEMIQKLRAEIRRRGADAVLQEIVLGDKKLVEEDSHWRRGAVGTAESAGTRVKETAPSAYEKGVVERNRKWIGQLETALQGKKNVMVLVGRERLAGKDGLLQLLTEAGFSVQQMHGVDRPD